MQRLRAHWTTIGSLALWLSLSWLIVYAAGGANTIPPHVVFIPVFLAGWRLGVWAAVATAALGGIITGPLLPADVAGSVAQPVTDWSVRLGFFVGIGAFVAVIVQRWRAEATRAMRLAHREQDLAMRESIFLQSISHELRSPLTVIMGVVYTLEQRAIMSDAAEPLIESLRRGVERLDRLCTMALASVGVLDSVDPGSAVPLNPRRLMLEVADELSDLDGRRRLMVQSPNEERSIGSHPRLLRPALSALVENALKFSPSETPVEAVITIEAEETRISIRDFGDGMDPEMLGRAFDPFIQQDEGLSRRHDGMGIGLFAARRLIEQLHGELAITSQPGRGTEAVVILPTPELPAAKRLSII